METASATSIEVSPTVCRPRVVREPRSRGRRLRRFVLSLSPRAWAVLDVLIIALATSGAHTLLFMVSTGFEWVASPWLATLTFCVSVLIAGLVFGLYEHRTLLERSRILLRSVLTLLLGVALGFACLSLFFYALASRWVGLTVALGYLGLAIPLRLYAHEVITASRVRLLCVGSGASIRKLVRMLGRVHNRHYQVVGHVRAAERPLGAALKARRGPRFWSDEELRLQDACPCLGELEDLPHVLVGSEVDEVVVGSELSASPAVGQAVSVCLEGRCRVTDQITFVEKLLGEVPAESISTDWFLMADVQNRASHEGVKRVLDLAAAACGLLVTLPLWPLIGLLIRLDSRGPVLFRQLRVGQHGRVFTIYKARTMRIDAEREGARWACENDERVTRVGRFLRKSRLDELPQLFNVLRGDMALVGPRPERPEFVHNLEQLLPHYRLRHLIKPGLSGWAQIHYGYGSSVADAHRKLCYDLYYLKHRSIDLDLRILIRTVGTLALGAR